MLRLTTLLLALCAVPCAGAGGREVPAGTLVDVAAAALVQSLARVSGAVELEPVGRVESLPVPEGVIDITARAPSRPNPARPLRVWLDVRVDGKPYRAVPVLFALGSAPQRRVVAAVALPLTTAVAPQAALPNPMPPPLLAASLRNTAAPKLAVVRGQTVAVSLQDNGIVVETSGLALADGRIGERVPVRATGATATTGNRQVFSATVSAERRVTIETR
jgi:Chaperone for flagella basal body P-ring formation